MLYSLPHQNLGALGKSGPDIHTYAFVTVAFKAYLACICTQEVYLRRGEPAADNPAARINTASLEQVGTLRAAALSAMHQMRVLSVLLRSRPSNFCCRRLLSALLHGFTAEVSSSHKLCRDFELQ